MDVEHKPNSEPVSEPASASPSDAHTNQPPEETRQSSWKTMSGTRIGLIGGPESGKSTYLASLRLAALRDKTRNWSISGADEVHPGSINYLQTALQELERLNLPERTKGERKVGFHIRGVARVEPQEVPAPRRASWHELMMPSYQPPPPPPTPAPRPFHFFLSFKDVEGIYYSTKTDPLADFWVDLAACNGLIYLFDPKPKKPGDNYAHLGAALEYVAAHRRTDGTGLLGLPQFVAVCITKCDSILGKPVKLDRRYVDLMADRSEMIDAKGAFPWLAQQSDDRLVSDTIESLETLGRIEYFAVSSVGFFEKKDGTIDPNDANNVEEIDDPNAAGAKRPHLRSKAKPVNVLKPLEWLSSKLALGAAGIGRR